MREEGYYFVKYKGKQEVAYFTPETTTSFEYWLKIQEKYEDLSVMRKYWSTLDFDEIGDKIELPKETTLLPKKYDHNTFKGELIEKIVTTSIISNNVKIYTKNYIEEFYVDENIEGYGADSILCLLQNNRDINVSKY